MRSDIWPALSSSSVSFLSRSSTFSTFTLIMSTTCMQCAQDHQHTFCYSVVRINQLAFFKSELRTPPFHLVHSERWQWHNTTCANTIHLISKMTCYVSNGKNNTQSATIHETTTLPYDGMEKSTLLWFWRTLLFLVSENERHFAAICKSNNTQKSKKTWRKQQNLKHFIAKRQKTNSHAT